MYHPYVNRNSLNNHSLRGFEKRGQDVDKWVLIHKNRSLLKYTHEIFLSTLLLLPLLYYCIYLSRMNLGIRRLHPRLDRDSEC